MNVILSAPLVDIVGFPGRVSCSGRLRCAREEYLQGGDRHALQLCDRTAIAGVAYLFPLVIDGISTSLLFCIDVGKVCAIVCT